MPNEKTEREINAFVVAGTGFCSHNTRIVLNNIVLCRAALSMFEGILNVPRKHNPSIRFLKSEVIKNKHN